MMKSILQAFLVLSLSYLSVISKYVELTFWKIDIIKSSYINDRPTTIEENVENDFFDSPQNV